MRPGKYVVLLALMFFASACNGESPINIPGGDVPFCGGGSGGYDSGTRPGGGVGAAGVVYVEW